MTIEQTIEIPPSRRISLDLPPELPVGKARISILSVAKEPKTDRALLSMRGSCKGIDTLDKYFARKQANKAMEDLKTGNS